MRNLLFLLVLLTFSLISGGQNPATENNDTKANNISIGFVGLQTYPVGVSFSQMFTDKLSLEIGAGLLSVGGGFTYYFTNPQNHRFNFYAGIFGGLEFENVPMFYVPVGISYFGKKNLQYSVDIGPMFSEAFSVSEDDPNPLFWFGLKAGPRFGPDVDVLNSREITS